MERRGFLKTLVGGITSAGLLLKANPAEVEASGLIVMPDAPVILSPHEVNPPMMSAPFDDGQVLYDARGRAVALVTSVAVTTPRPFEITSFRDAHHRYLPGPGAVAVAITAEGLPASMDWLHDSFRAGR